MTTKWERISHYNKFRRSLSVFQNIIMRTNSSEKVEVFVDLKSKTIEHIDTAFPPVFKSLHFLDPQRRMSDVLHKYSHLPVKLILDAGRQFKTSASLNYQ